MKTKQSSLRASLGPELAAAFSGGSAGASVGIISGLPPREKRITREAFADSLSTMWIVYVAFSALGTVVAFLITKNVLSKDHEETKTGLEEEKRKMEERKAERAARKKAKGLGSNEKIQEEGVRERAPVKTNEA